MKPKQQAQDDGPEELDGYQLERPNDQEQPAITYSVNVVEIHQPDQNQEIENETAY